MNKSKIILAATGGIIALLVLVMAYFVWSAYCDKTAALEGDDDSEGLEGVVSKATQLSRKPIYPSALSVKAITSNAQAVVSWKDEAEKLIAKGDRAYPPTTPAAFKTFIVSDAKRLVEGFDFGPFKDYIVGGKMPETTQLDKLQRQWDDVALLTEVLLKCGMKKLTAVDFAVANTEAQEEAPKPKKGKKAKKGKGDAEKVTFNPNREAYTFTFTIAPAGFVRVLNALETSERFVIVDGFTFHRERDVVAEALGGAEKRDAQTANVGRRRRRSVVVEEKKPEDDPKNAIITDPMLDPPFVVKLTVSVYDFRTLEDKKEEGEGK